MLNVPVSQVRLQRPGVRAVVRQLVAAGMAKHVRMRLQLDASADGRALDHPGEASGRERRTALADEDEGRWHALALQASQGPQLVAEQGMRLVR